jgi:hypothetical protein
VLTVAFLILVCVNSSIAQTTLISPTGDGGFETGSTFADNGWTAVNATTNTWNLGTVPAWFTGSRGAYISNNSGTAWQYTNNTVQASHIYRDVAFPAGETNITLSFSWRGNGNDGNWDNLQVYLANTTITPTTAGPTNQSTTTTGWTGYTDGTTGYYLTRINGTTTPTTTTTVTYTLTAAQAAYAAGNTRRLIFSWKNDGSGGSNPPASIDNISLTSVCIGAATAAATNIGITTAQANWAAFAGATSYNLRYKTTAGSVWTTLTGLTGTSSNLTSLTAATAYEYQISAIGGSCSSWSTSANFTTQPVSTVTWTEGFTTTTLPTGWTNASSSAWLLGSARGATGNPGNNMFKNIFGTGSSGSQFSTTNIGPLGANDRLTFDFKTSNFSSPYAAPGAGTGSYTIAVSTDAGATWTNLATVGTGTTNTWQQGQYPLSSYSGQYVKFRITGTWVSGDWDLAFDNFKVEPTPSCDLPTAVTSSAITTSTATISWTASSSAPTGGYEYEVRTSGAAGSGATGRTATGTVSGTSANITGLAPGTAYSVYLRALCGTPSGWTAAYNFTTQYASPVTWTEGFTSTTLPVGWTNASSSVWALGSTRGVTGNPGNNIYKNIFGTASSGAQFSTTNIGPLGTNDRLTFDFKTSNFSSPYAAPAAGSGSYTIAVSTDFGATWTDLATVNNSGSNAWQQGVYPLASYTGQYVKFRITGTWVSGDWDLAFDNFRVEPTPTCFPPSSVTASAASYNTATISWPAATPAPGDGYEYYYNTSNATPAVGATASGSTGAGVLTANLSSLTENTTYYVWVRSICSSSDKSAWSSVASFVTPCGFATIPYTENFDGVTAPALPACTTVQNVAGSGTWRTIAIGPRSAPNSLRVDYDSSAAMNDWYFTKALNLTANTSYRLRFWYANSNSADYPEKMEVKFGTANNAAGMTSAPLFSNTNIISNVYTEAVADFTPTTSGLYYIGFHGFSDADMAYIYLDDISVDLTPPCASPTAVVINNITSGSASVQVTSSASSFIVEYGPTGFTPGTGATAGTNGTVVAGTSTTIALPSLSPSTAYDVYVRTNCDPVYSTNTTVVRFTTPCTPTSVPYTEDFESVTTPAIPACASIQNAGTGSNWVTVNNPGYGFTNKTLQYVYAANYNANAWFYTRGITLEANTSYRISYRYGSGGSPEKLNVFYGTAPEHTAMATMLADHPNVTSTTPITNTLDFTATASGVFYFGFHAYSDYDEFYLFVDDISIIKTPTCEIPTAVAVNGTTTTGTNITWVAPTLGNAPAEYQYEVRLSGAAGSGSTGLAASGTVTAPTLTAAVGGLADSTTYYIYMRSHCGGSDYSAWTAATSFTTVCNALTTLPWTENFDSMTTLGSGVLPNCWATNGGTSWNYTSANAATNTYTDPRSTPNYVTMHWLSGDQANLWTPGFQLTAGTSYTFSFYFSGDGYTGWDGSVLINGAQNGTGATQLGTPFISAATTTSTSYTLVTRTFVPTTTGTYYFGIKTASNSTPYYLGYDDFSVTKTPSDISGISPDTVCSVGGETVTILGTNLTGTTSVAFNGVAAASFNVTNNSTITAVTPAGVTTGPITIVTPLNTAVSSTNVTVNATPVVADITGDTTICTSTPATLSSATTGGTWTSTNTTVATVNATSGLVTGLTAGTTTIVYTVTTNGCSATKTATVTVYETPAISSVTSTQAVTPGSTATYSVTATGSGLTYQWEANTGSGWTALTNDSTYAGVTTATLTVSNATLAMDGHLFRVTVSGTSPCTAVTSSPASTLFVSQVGIAADPVSVTNCSSTTTASFNVTATGTSVTYQWQQSTNSGSSWTNIANGTASGVTYSGATTATLSLSDLTTANSGYLFRVVVTDASSNTATSNDATLTINEVVVIGTQPASQYACTGIAASKTFTVAYTGAGTIEWQYSANGTTWASIADASPAGVTYTGATTSSLTATTTAATVAGTYSYRAVITAVAPCSNVTSDVVTLTVGLPTVSVTPSAATYCNPGTGVTLAASGASTYTWAPATGLSATSGASVVASPTATTTYTVTGTDANGCTATSSVTITVNSTPTATAIAAATEVCEGGTVQLDVNATAAFTTPAVSSYVFTNTTGTFTQVSAAATAVPNVVADDAISATLPIGFTFNYGGNTYTQFRMASNGFISFNTSATNVTDNNLSAANAALRPIIAPLWDDLDGRPTGSTAYAGYELTGTAPNRVLTIEWRNWEWNYQAGAAVISFQVKLYEGSNNIEFAYRGEATAVSAGTATIGIGAPTGSGNGSYLNLTSVATPAVSSTTASNSINTKPATGTIYRFTPGNAPTLTYAWTSTPAGFTSSAKNPIATVSANTTYNVTVTTATGCATTSSVSVNATSGANITAQPVASTLCQGGNFTLSVTATGPGLTYQWRKGGVNIPSATATTYTLTGAVPADSASYDVVITPACGDVLTSDAVAVLVNPTPTATAPANVTVCNGTSVSAITLTGTPSGVTFDVTGGAAIGLSNLTGVTTIPAFTATAAGTATITLTPKANGCTGTPVTFTITSTPAPTAVTITASATSLCNGAVATLTSTGGISSTTASASSGTVSLAIPDNSATGITQALAISGIPAGATVTKVDVTFSLTHEWLVDAEVVLQAPNGKYIALAADQGPIGSGSYVNTVITSDNTAPVLSSTAATITGRYRANATTAGNLKGSFGTNLTSTFSDLFTVGNGNWNVIAYDDASGDTGTLTAAAITITYDYTPPAVWSPTAGLYTDAAATTAYTGGALATVYAAPTANTTYTATVTNGNNCSASNTVSITSASSSAPTAADQQFCPGATVANLTATGTNVQWYTVSTGGTALSSSTALVSGTYYATQTTNGCESNRTAVVVTILSSWTGAVSSNWGTPGNWCGNVVPTAAVDVIIPAVSTLPVIATGDTALAHNLTVSQDATLTVTTGATLSVDNRLSVHPQGTLTVQDNAALIQGAATATNTNNGKIDFIKKSSNLFRLDYTLWASPVAGQNLAAFSPTTSATRFYTYNPVSDAYAGATAAATDFAEATAYLIRMPNVNAAPGYNSGDNAIQYNGNFIGEPHNGTVTKTLSTAGNGYNGVGNPYPSPINLADFFEANTGVIDGSGIYFWRKKNDGASSSYATLTLAAFTANQAVGGGSENAEFYQYDPSTGSDNWLIAPAQGFLVKTAGTTGTPTLTFTNAMRRPTPGTSQSFFRTAPSTSSRLWVNMTATTGATSQTAVAYMNNATMGIDYGYDGIKFAENNTLAFYSLAQNTALTIQARPAFVNTDIVPMGYFAPTAGTHTINLHHTDGVFTQGQTIYLRDNLNGMIANLSENSYTFVTEAGTIENRFEILYNTEALGTDVPTLDANNVVVVKEGTTITVNTGSVLMNGITIYDTRGRKVYSMSDINNTQTAISNLTAEQQVLIVEINTVKGKVSKRIIF